MSSKAIIHPARTLIRTRLPDFLPNEIAGMEITRALYLIMEEEVLPDDLVPLCVWAVGESPEMEGTTEQRLRLIRLLDDEIIFQTETLGQRILLSPVVAQRVATWEQTLEGYALYEKWCQALLRYNRYLHSVGQVPPLDRGMKASKAATVAELRQLLKVLPLAGNAAKLASEFERLASEQNCPEILRNLDSWLLFIRKNASAIRTQRRAPASLFDLWLGFTTGREPEALRQLVSKL